jgi:hypothetical protein
MSEGHTRPSARLELVGLGLVVIAGVALRSVRLSWGLPDYTEPDGVMYFVRPGVRLIGFGELVPGHFVHPPLLVYVTALVFWIWSLVTGHAIAPAGGQFYAQLPALVFVGRVTAVAFSGAIIVALYFLGRALLGVRAALLGAAVFALAPLQVLEAHRVNPDTPSMLLIVVASLIAAVAHARRSPRGLAAAYAMAGLAGAFKLTGAAAAAVPAWLTLTWPGGSLRRRMRWAAAGVGLTLLALALGCLPAFFDWAKAWDTSWKVIWYTYAIGMSGVDIQAEGWTYTRYVYGLVVGLPYMMGWPAYLAALAGLVLLVRDRRRAAGAILAFVVPYFVFMGGAVTISHRYYLPLAPFLALLAGAALDRVCGGRAELRRGGPAVAAVVLAYTAALSVSHCLRLDLGPQRQVAALVAEEARALDPSERPLNVAYPHPLGLYYDAVRPLLQRIEGVKVVYYPSGYGDARAEPSLPSEEAALEQERRWAEEKDVGVVILPSWDENAIRRERPDGTIAHFYRHLSDGALGFRPAGHFRTRYLTQDLYTWGDPMLDTHWETAIVGYRVFVRDRRAARP